MATSAPLLTVPNYFQTTTIVAHEVTDDQTKVTDERLFPKVSVVQLTPETDRYVRVVLLFYVRSIFLNIQL